MAPERIDRLRPLTDQKCADAKDHCGPLGATRLQAWRKVVVPAALPWILSTLRLNVGFALIGAVVGEYISSQEGLGYLVYYSGVLYDLNGVWAGIIALMVVALLMDRGVTEIDRRLRW